MREDLKLNEKGLTRYLGIPEDEYIDSSIELHVTPGNEHTVRFSCERTLTREELLEMLSYGLMTEEEHRAADAVEDGASAPQDPPAPLGEEGVVLQEVPTLSVRPADIRVLPDPDTDNVWIVRCRLCGRDWTLGDKATADHVAAQHRVNHESGAL